jgi:hypothetical protein
VALGIDPSAVAACAPVAGAFMEFCIIIAIMGFGIIMGLGIIIIIAGFMPIIPGAVPAIEAIIICICICICMNCTIIGFPAKAGFIIAGCPSAGFVVVSRDPPLAPNAPLALLLLACEDGGFGAASYFMGCLA